MNRELMQLALDALESASECQGKDFPCRKVNDAIAELRAALAAPVAPADGWEHLKVYGYAPGDYMSRCHKCGLTPAGLDKRATTCRPCAEAMHAAAPAELPTTRSQRMRDAGFTRRPTWHSLPGDDEPTPVAPVGMAYVPLVMTQAMRDVTDSEGWTWEDLLAAAEAITESQYEKLAAAAAPVAPAEPFRHIRFFKDRDECRGIVYPAVISDAERAHVISMGDQLIPVHRAPAAPASVGDKPATSEPVAWQWRRKGEPWSREQTWTYEVFATTDDSEVRALYTAPPDVPPGWVLVPAEPTKAMMKAFQDQMHREFGMHTTAGYHHRVYDAMLAASPKAPT